MKGSTFKKSSLGLVLAGLALSGCSPAKSSGGAANAGIVNGTLGQAADVQSGGVAESVVIIIAQLPLPNDPTRAMVATCSGTLIAPQIILTAGHCVPASVQASNMRVGLHYLSVGQNQQNPGASGYNVKAFIKYPNFDENDSSGVQNDDLALLLLEKPVPAGTRIATLPTQAELTAMQLSGATAIGYGQSDERASADPHNNGAGTLRYVTFPTTDDLFGILPATKEDGSPFSNANMLAVKSQSTSVCHGDSGGPLMAAIAGKTTDTIIGVNDAVEPDFADPALHQEWQQVLQSGSSELYKKFYADHPAAGVCSGGLNLFVNVAVQADWIKQTEADLLAGKGITTQPGQFQDEE